MLKNFHLKSIKEHAKARGREGAFIKFNGAIAVTTIFFIFIGGQDTPIRRWIKLKKGSIKITLFKLSSSPDHSPLSPSIRLVAPPPLAKEYGSIEDIFSLFSLDILSNITKILEIYFKPMMMSI